MPRGEATLIIFNVSGQDMTGEDHFAPLPKKKGGGCNQTLRVSFKGSFHSHYEKTHFERWLSDLFTHRQCDGEVL